MNVTERLYNNIRSNRNQLSSTMGNGGFIRGNSENRGIKPSMMSQYGSNLMN